mmetsp:Transcript_36084/g.91989  ORF Transcript_36084/g.91989 Transcript_36084/m.91989 type:complete len:404 (-) Transcript_36084:207-1418(-)
MPVTIPTILLNNRCPSQLLFMSQGTHANRNPPCNCASSLHLLGNVLEVRAVDALVMFWSHVGMHVADHHDDAILLALQAMHPMIVTAVPRNHFTLLPFIGLVRNDELGTFETRDTDVNVQDVVGRPTVRLNVGALLHLDDHDLLVLVRSPRKTWLRWQVLLQHSASLGEDGLTFLRELALMVQHDPVPLALLVEEAVSILVAAVCLIAQRAFGLYTESLEVILKHLADWQLIPSFAWPHLLAAQATHPNLRRMLEIVPQHCVTCSVLPDLAVPSHGGDAVEKILGLLDHPCIFVLQGGDLGVQRHASALELVLLVEITEALRVLHQLFSKLQASHDKLIVSGIGVKDMVYCIQVEQEVRHVFQLPILIRCRQDILHAIKCDGPCVRALPILDVVSQLLHTRMP